MSIGQARLQFPHSMHLFPVGLIFIKLNLLDGIITNETGYKISQLKISNLIRCIASFII